MTIGIAINGAGGRMGTEIARVVCADRALRLVACADRADHPQLGADMGSLIGAAPTGVTLQGRLPASLPAQTVLVDFSAPDATMDLLGSLPATVESVVVGTTGLSAAQLDKIAQAAKSRAILHSPNMSLGVNLLFYLTELVARRLGSQFDIEIVETHHHHKKDAPSGTARRLGEIAAEAVGLSYGNDVVHGRNGIVGERPKREIGMHAVRGGDIVGDHLVLFAGEGERLELRHMAHSRSTLAVGAVTAAKWLPGRPAGLYSMQDVLGLKGSA